MHFFSSASRLLSHPTTAFSEGSLGMLRDSVEERTAQNSSLHVFPVRLEMDYQRIALIMHLNNLLT